MKKKIIMVLLSSMFILTACGSKEPQEPETVETLIETTQVTEEETEKETETEAEPETEKQEIVSSGDLSDDIYSFQIEVEGIVYQLPMEYEELTSYGWEPKGDVSEELNPGTYTTSEVFSKGDYKIYASFYNPGENVVPFSESLIGGITIADDMGTEVLSPVILPGGIAMGESTVDDVKAAYGEPSRVYEGEYYTKLEYEYESYRDIEIQVSTETNVVSEIKVRNLTIPDNTSGGSNDGDAQGSNEPTDEVLAYKAPSSLGDDLNSYIVEFDGDLYQIPAPVAEFEKNGWKVQADNSESKVNAKSSGWITIMKNNQTLKVLCKNYGKEATGPSNCFVTKVVGDANSTDLPITVQKGITRGMTQAELEKALSGISYEMDESSTLIFYTIVGESKARDYVTVVYNSDKEIVTKIEVYNEPKEFGLIVVTYKSYYDNL